MINLNMLKDINDLLMNKNIKFKKYILQQLVNFFSLFGLNILKY